eukprot:CAMPEP_0198699652 /NCGR_PEP_ID=MMETSP1468-20131203/357234_1 /TAXON_ID=1461545 /ORGANISM="Mantoniella sp, Strain CCMP1436" /LENGTH=42 /DNA_ID= /DNA_START= /DNA_END= /DNA_ORIENTATION=
MSLKPRVRAYVGSLSSLRSSNNCLACVTRAAKSSLALSTRAS